MLLSEGSEGFDCFLYLNISTIYEICKLGNRWIQSGLPVFSILRGFLELLSKCCLRERRVPLDLRMNTGFVLVANNRIAFPMPELPTAVHVFGPLPNGHSVGDFHGPAFSAQPAPSFPMAPRELLPQSQLTLNARETETPARLEREAPSVLRQHPGGHRRNPHRHPPRSTGRATPLTRVTRSTRCSRRQLTCSWPRRPRTGLGREHRGIHVYTYAHGRLLAWNGRAEKRYDKGSGLVNTEAFLAHHRPSVRLCLYAAVRMCGGGPYSTHKCRPRSFL